MKTIDLKSFFKLIDYDWKKDEDVIKEICRLTKTRVKNPIPTEMFSYGMEQTFFLKAITDYLKPKNIIEIGTGRGTGSYAMSMTESVETITTIDIIPFTQKQNTAIGFEPAIASNEDLYRLVPNESKNKIEFVERKNYNKKHVYDFAFIDGDHTNEDIIMNDFDLCKESSIIVWDDYDPSQFAVKPVVEKVLKENEYECFLLEFRGHLFGPSEEKNAGELVMFKKGVFGEDLD